ncbi:Uncharacterised protein [Mycobacteroides abscessus subsp. abscessus]|nr:Uncharacterised protein [Mycobacteroides abscessus subsp. abscessus]
MWSLVITRYPFLEHTVSGTSSTVFSETLLRIDRARKPPL